MSDALDALRRAGAVDALDERFARAVGTLAGEGREAVLLAAALVSRQVSAGHVCLDLAAQPLESGAGDGEAATGAWPPAGDWRGALEGSPLVGGPKQVTPLVLHGDRLYLRRYFEHEQGLARALLRRARPAAEPVDDAVLNEGLDRLFPPPADARPDLQRLAARTAVARRFTVISGGPGTGKTSTVVKILALLVEQSRARGSRLPRIALLAPTGKAAARLVESIERAKATLAADADVIEAIPDAAATIHRALGTVRGSSTRFRHDADRPLLADVVLIDEASMVDLALMARLLEAVPEGARLILLGDRDQLASVEAGAVLGDICGGAAVAGGVPGQGPPIARSIVQLTRSWRYREDSGIGALARAVHRGDGAAALAVLGDPRHPDVELLAPRADGHLSAPLRARVVAGYRPYLEAEDPAAALAAFDAFRVLCAHRRGPHGVEPVNREVAGLLVEEDLVALRGAHFPGRPVMVTRNDYAVGLFNGDVGLELAGPADSGVRAFFPGEGGALRALSPGRLPQHETVWAMSVHKSQGSEVDEVAVLLPVAPSRVLSRELLYTAVTRARERVVVYATPEIVRYAVEHRVERASGLRDALWGT